MKKIIATKKNRRILKSHAKEALADYSHVMTWLLLGDDGMLWELVEAQGQTIYTGADYVVATTGSFTKAHGDGAARDEYGAKYASQRGYLIDLLGEADYRRIFSGRPKND